MVFEEGIGRKEGPDSAVQSLVESSALGLARTGDFKPTIPTPRKKSTQRPHAPRHPRQLPSINTVANMAEVTLRTRKFIRNPLLGRKQMVVYV
jgi:hypothetical protein